MMNKEQIKLIKRIKKDVNSRFPNDWNEDLQTYFDMLIKGDLPLPK